MLVIFRKNPEAGEVLWRITWKKFAIISFFLEAVRHCGKHGYGLHVKKTYGVSGMARVAWKRIRCGSVLKIAEFLCVCNSLLFRDFMNAALCRVMSCCAKGYGLYQKRLRITGRKLTFCITFRYGKHWKETFLTVFPVRKQLQNCISCRFLSLWTVFSMAFFLLW